MPFFARQEGWYVISMITGPRSVLLRLQLSPEPIKDPEVIPLRTEYPYRNPDIATVRARVLEGTDEANQAHGTAYHPRAIRYAVEDNESCTLLRHAARTIVERIVTRGEVGYDASAREGAKKGTGGRSPVEEA